MRICILGGGHMGSWLADTLGRSHDVSMFDADAGVLATSGRWKRLTSLPSIRDERPEMLINAVSLQNTLDAFREADPFLPDGCVLCDVASVKGDLPEFYGSTGRRFVSLHPMFGPTFARMEHLKGENAVIIVESDVAAKEFWRSFFEGFGVTVFEYPFADHDPMMAYSLTLPFVSSLVFSSCVSMKAVPGTTFRKHLEVAKGLLGENDYLLTEILFNRESLGQLKKISARLNHLWHIVDQRDSEEAQKFIGSLRGNLLPPAPPEEGGAAGAGDLSA